MTDTAENDQSDDRSAIEARLAALAGWRGWLTTAALAFVIGAVIVLMLLPLLTFTGLDRLEARSRETYDVGKPLLMRLRFLHTEEALPPDLVDVARGTPPMDVYFRVRAEEDSIYRRLRDLASSVDGPFGARLTALAQVDSTWHRRSDSRADSVRRGLQDPGLPPPAQRDRDHVLVDSVLAANISATNALDQFEIAQRRRGAREVASLRNLSPPLGVIALFAIVVAAAVGRRERRLTHALADTLRDLGARIRAEQIARAEAQAAVAVRDQVLHIVSHDLKNPLHTMTMAQELMRDPATSVTTRERYLGIMDRAVSRMSRLVMDLLDVGRLESGHPIAIEPKPTRLGALLTETAESFDPEARQKGVRLHVESDADALVLVDPVRILQVLANLVGNALKFTPSGGSIDVWPEHHGAEWRVTVANDGTPIPPENLTRLFQPFWQARETAMQGTGLGLSIVKGIVEAHGGQVTVTSSVEERTRFTFTIPAVAETTETASVEYGSARG
jgi:signal transduction histidine kinase